MQPAQGTTNSNPGTTTTTTATTTNDDEFGILALSLVATLTPAQRLALAAAAVNANIDESNAGGPNPDPFLVDALPLQRFDCLSADEQAAINQQQQQQQQQPPPFWKRINPFAASSSSSATSSLSVQDPAALAPPTQTEPRPTSRNWFTRTSSASRTNSRTNSSGQLQQQQSHDSDDEDHDQEMDPSLGIFGASRTSTSKKPISNLLSPRDAPVASSSGASIHGRMGNLALSVSPSLLPMDYNNNYQQQQSPIQSPGFGSLDRPPIARPSSVTSNYASFGPVSPNPNSNLISPNNMNQMYPTNMNAFNQNQALYQNSMYPSMNPSQLQQQQQQQQQAPYNPYSVMSLDAILNQCGYVSSNNGSESGFSSDGEWGGSQTSHRSSTGSHVGSPRMNSSGHGGIEKNSGVVKPFLCIECGRSFLRKHDFKRHVITTHHSSEVETIQCDVCLQKFKRLDGLRRHQKGRCRGPQPIGGQPEVL